MAFRLSTTARNAACNGIVDAIDAGAGAGKLKVYTNAQVGSVGGSEAGNTLLGTLTMSDPAFGSAATGVATASAITSDTSADASGTAGHVNVTDSDDNVIADMDAAQGSGTANFDNTTVVAGGTIACSAFTVTVPIN